MTEHWPNSFNFRLRNNDQQTCSDKYQTLPNKPKRIPSSSVKRFHSDERPQKRLKWTPPAASQHQQLADLHGGGQYATLPHRVKQKSQKVSKTASFHLGPLKSDSSASSVKRENSLTSRLQDQSMGIHKLIFDRLNNNNDCDKEKCQQQSAKSRLLSLEEQRKLVKFRRFLLSANIGHTSEFLTQIQQIRQRQKREARRSIVDEHGMPASYYTQSR